MSATSKRCARLPTHEPEGCASLFLARSHEGGHEAEIKTFSALLFHFISPNLLLGVNLVYFQSLAVVQH